MWAREPTASPFYLPSPREGLHPWAAARLSDEATWWGLWVQVRGPRATQRPLGSTAALGGPPGQGASLWAGMSRPVTQDLHVAGSPPGLRVFPEGDKPGRGERGVQSPEPGRASPTVEPTCQPSSPVQAARPRRPDCVPDPPPGQLQSSAP